MFLNIVIVFNNSWTKKKYKDTITEMFSLKKGGLKCEKEAGTGSIIENAHLVIE